MAMAAAKKQEQASLEDLTPQIMDPGFWRNLAPGFNVEGPDEPGVLQITDDQKKKLVAKMDKEAYVHLSQPGLKSPLKEMRNLLSVIEDMGLPPVFAFAYDEFWNISRQVRPLVKTLLEADEFSVLPDFWCWRVKPGQAGWKPHRDKVRGSLFPNGKPKSITLWVPLSVAHPLNGCMYILPADRDSIYYRDGENGFHSSLPDVRALPGEAGDVFSWTQRVFHWGSHSADDHSLPPRQSVAFEYQRCDIPAFNSPLLDPDRIPDFKARMALIGKQVQQYTHMYEFTPDLVRLAQTLVKEFGLPPATGKSLPQ